MTTVEDANTNAERIEEAEKKNPLLKKGLGELVQEANRICMSDPNVIKLEEDIPQESLKNYGKYIEVVKELNRREENYNSYELPPTF